MIGLVSWAASHARMVMALVLMTLFAGTATYISLPKEGEPDIEVPAVIITVPFPGISAVDGETMLVRPMETELSDLDGLKTLSAFSADGFAAAVLEFEFGWDKTATLAEIRDAMGRAEGNFPSGAQNYAITEINFSEFPMIIVAVSGDVSERALLRATRDLQRRIEGLDSVLEAEIAGARDEMVEVLIDPLRLEAYNVTAGELISVVTQNNQLVAAGEVETSAGAFGVTVPASFAGPEDIYRLPVKVNGDSVVRLGDLAEIRMTFADRAGTARFNGETNLAIQVVKRKGFNAIDTAEQVRAAIATERASWPEELQAAITITPALDTSVEVDEMVRQLEGSVLTAIALVMIVVLAALGARSAMLVGFAIPASFLLCFILLGLMGVAVSNIVMFGLILAVGVLVDGAVVVTEYADKRLQEGDGPMQAYVKAAQRMFWPITASTATTLCAFLPMLFWPGVAGEFMGLLPVTLIFVLTASLIVALIFLPVLGGISGRAARVLGYATTGLRRLPWVARVPFAVVAAGAMWLGAMLLLNPGYLQGATQPAESALQLLPGAILMLLAAMGISVSFAAIKPEPKPRRIDARRRYSVAGHVMRFFVGNPVMPVVLMVVVAAFVVGTFQYYGENNRGVEFFVETEPERGIIYVRARGNFSITEKDALVRQVEEITLAEDGIDAVFAFAGAGGLNTNTAGAGPPRDAIGQIQFEMTHWQTRVGDPYMRGAAILERLEQKFDQLPGIQTEFLVQSGGPSGQKPVHLRLKGQDFDVLEGAVETVLARMRDMPGLFDLEDSRPIPGIDWQIDVDTAMAGRFGADVATIGGMVQLITRGLLLDTMRIDSSDEEVDIRVRLPDGDRLLSTLETLRVQTSFGMVPLSNFISTQAVARRGQIDRVDQQRFFDVKSDVRAGLVRLVDASGETMRVVPRAQTILRENEPGSDGYATAQATLAEIEQNRWRIVPITATERITALTEWLTAESPLPDGVDWQWTGEQQDQEESTQFLMVAFSAALGLMFVILLTQFNSFYNSVLVLLAVVLSSAGVLIGMLVMDQTFSVIMTGTGIVALAGIVVNNNIVLIDTYQNYAAIMPRIEAIIRTVEARIRPVLMTTTTTMAGLTPMMLGISIDFANGGYAIDNPTSLWWKQLGTAVVFGLGVATILTLMLTPAMLALRVWIEKGAYRGALGLRWLLSPRESAVRRDNALERKLRTISGTEVIWHVPPPAPLEEQLPLQLENPVLPPASLRAAE
ncbi:efflux RND transporter permease subunit [Roseinatronobacter alkalisoli]|uniref:Efflux RND transporter permease subunit n=1 Tax=Roseinatronobacter alkalisoli TaxID=3028235 RepID=A0ABT5T3A6_9RHOB|nr:efflux RND transporter permease subunit [Roseinatronobacter sp. HJB301]MDD7969595.1 efflux RND transporter permease subunit [Roseinatronobacter sp. HJB301]